MLMVLVSYLQWWYTKGWSELIARSARGLRGIVRQFSVPILIRTLFSPWKRIITYGQKGLPEILKALVDNLISRLVGFVVRVLALIAAVVSLTIVGVVSAVLIVAWPIIPLLSLSLIAIGVLQW